jgi:hypothetical protein
MEGLKRSLERISAKKKTATAASKKKRAYREFVERGGSKSVRRGNWPLSVNAF